MHKVDMGLVGNMRYIGIFMCNDLVNFLMKLISVALVWEKWRFFGRKLDSNTSLSIGSSTGI